MSFGRWLTCLLCFSIFYIVSFLFCNAIFCFVVAFACVPFALSLCIAI